MHPTHLFRSAVVAAAVAAAAGAQTTKTLPAHADLGDGHHAVALPFGVPGFRTQLLLDAAAVGPNGAVLTGLRLRADRGAAPQAAVTVPNVTVQVSHCSTALGNLSGTFAGNVTGPTTTVFQGGVTLPATTPGFAGPTSWDIAIPFATPFTFTAAQGNLLVDIVGNNAAQQLPVYWLDAVQGGGGATSYGTPGDDPNFDTMNLLVATGNSLEPRLLSPGHAVDFISTRSFTSPPGVLALGIAGLPAPIDLGPLGAPTNALYIDPLVLSAHAWTTSFIGRYSTFTLAVPGNPLLIGERVYGQSVIFDASANALGLVVSNAVEMRLGDQAEVLPMQQLDADDPAAATGTVLDFGFGQPERGAVALLLEGVFF